MIQFGHDIFSNYYNFLIFFRNTLLNMDIFYSELKKTHIEQHRGYTLNSFFSKLRMHGQCHIIILVHEIIFDFYHGIAGM